MSRRRGWIGAPRPGLADEPPGWPWEDLAARDRAGELAPVELPPVELAPVRETVEQRIARNREALDASRRAAARSLTRGPLRRG